MLRILSSLPLLHLAAMTAALPTSGKSNGIPCRAAKSFDSELTKTYPTIHDINIHFPDLAQDGEFDGWIRTPDSCYISVNSLPSAIDSTLGDSGLQSRQVNPYRWLTDLAAWLPRYVTGSLQRIIKVSNERRAQIDELLDAWIPRLQELQKVESPEGNILEEFNFLDHNVKCAALYGDLYNFYRANMANQVTLFLSQEEPNPIALKNTFESLEVEFVEISETQKRIVNFDEFFDFYVNGLSACKDSVIFQQELHNLLPPN